MPICVKSEIGKLKKVMLHRPGKELEHLVPGELERLLFDDIPYLKTAQGEHDIFAGILKANKSQVVYMEDMMADVLRQSPDIRENFIRQFIREGGNTAQKFRNQLFDFLMDIPDEKELVLKTMSGVSMHEIKSETHSPLVAGVSLNCMYSRTRRRETIYGQYILEHHPDYGGRTPFYYKREYPFSIEGGDILNLSNRVLAVGISQRTTPEAIELLAQNLFEDSACEVETILALDIPSIRAYMHLDTVCTQVDHDKFTIHPGILGNLRIYEIRRGDRKGRLFAKELDRPLPDVLADYLGMIRCGGKDRVASEREQWNDGSNTLCIEPGKVVVYDRNYITNEMLRDKGIEVLEMPSSELSRGRGGPRCMSMPLVRD